MAPSEQTINIPQLILIIVIGGFALRYFFFSNSTTASGHTSRNGASNRAREQDVETIQQMFPQVPRRSIMWDLQRNGGSVAATTERILSGRGLENPPQSFQPLPPAPPLSSASTTSASSRSKSLLPDLITRYNLQSKLEEPEVQRQEEPVSGDGARKKQPQAWSQNKGERQALLQKRREEMILGARRKMEEKLAREKAASGTA